MVLWGPTFNAVVVIGVVSLILFRLPMAILWVSFESVCIAEGILIFRLIICQPNEKS
jgi:hypothetical protein